MVSKRTIELGVYAVAFYLMQAAPSAAQVRKLHTERSRCSR